MKDKRKKPADEPARKQGDVEIREDLQDGAKGKDLSYLNEMPQMATDEGVKAMIPPPREEDDQSSDKE